MLVQMIKEYKKRDKATKIKIDDGYSKGSQKEDDQRFLSKL